MNTINATKVKTFYAVINGKNVVVNTMVSAKNRNDVFYKVNGKEVSYNSFWAKKPEFLN